MIQVSLCAQCLEDVFGNRKIRKTNARVLTVDKVIRSVVNGAMMLRVDSPLDQLAPDRPALGLVSLHPRPQLLLHGLIYSLHTAIGL